MIQLGSLWKQENQISREFIDSVILMISCRVNGPNWRSTIGRDTGAKEQEQGFNVAFEIWLMDSTKKKQQNGPAKITILYSYPNSRPRR
jgi:hypothetical protein